MAVPKKKKSKSRTGMRRAANSAISLKNISYDKETGEPHLSHQISPKGFYGGKRIIEEKTIEQDKATQSQANA